MTLRNSSQDTPRYRGDRYRSSLAPGMVMVMGMGMRMGMGMEMAMAMAMAMAMLIHAFALISN